jgi:hypothetical protein
MLGLQLPLQETQGLGQSQSQGQAQAQGQGSVGDDFFAMLGLVRPVSRLAIPSRFKTSLPVSCEVREDPPWKLSIPPANSG